VKENVSFRLGKAHKRALTQLAAERDQAVGELIREAVEAYLAQQERAAWEVGARRASLALAREAEDSTSAEAEQLRMLEANLEDFAREWRWEEEA
jgi:predicted transcriptional regulator